MIRVVKLGFGVLLGWATYLVTVSSLKPGTAYRFLAALAVAAAAVLQLWSVITSWFGAGPAAVKQIEDVLLNRSVDLYHRRMVGSDLTAVSLHVWSVPLWYRRLVPYQLRRWARTTFSEGKQATWAMKPELRRLAYCAFPPTAPSGVVFKKGYGLIGLALDDVNGRGRVHSVNLEDRAYVAALARGPEAWRNEANALTKYLSHSDAEQLAQRYGQALAVAIRLRGSGEAIGCLTLEVKPGADVTLEGNKELAEELSVLADFLSPMVALA